MHQSESAQERETTEYLNRKSLIKQITNYNRIVE
jgi:hypothetical protein